MPDAQEEATRQEDPAVAIQNIVEKHRTTRFIALMIMIVFCVGIISAAYVALQRSIWEMLIPIVLGQGGLIMGLLRLHYRNTKRNHKRVQELEEKLDKNRTSSDYQHKPVAQEERADQIALPYAERYAQTDNTDNQQVQKLGVTDGEVQ